MNNWEPVSHNLYRKKVWKGWLIKSSMGPNETGSLTYLEDRKYEWVL